MGQADIRGLLLQLVDDAVQFKLCLAPKLVGLGEHPAFPTGGPMPTGHRALSFECIMVTIPET